MDAEPSGQDQTDERFNKGAWYGSQFGATLWMLLAGLGLLGEDILVAAAFLAGFACLNLWGVFLWRQSRSATAHATVQKFLAGGAIVVATVVPMANQRELSLDLPYWTLAVFPGMMLWTLLFLKNKLASGSLSSSP
ncbi:MAG: hypothetical protein P8N31_03135 [Planctomycetota bacterium]|nr:hypothetical protein [Planctomycetota bacterium]MDG2142526.1 hypothetical protein [Planctomycetota bacterium]